MKGVTEKKKRNTGKYLLFHRSGAIAKTKTLSVPHPIQGITAIINLETLEQLNDEQQWEKIPDGCDVLIAAEAQEEEAFEEEKYSEGEEELSILGIQTGARRIFNPNVVWAYCMIR